MLFSEFKLNTRIQSNLNEIGFINPTKIQQLAIPPIMESKDILATAETGSGKTAAFLLPVINAIMKKERGKTRVLVLVPTRELALQTVEHFQLLSKGTNLKAVAIYGGVGMNPQINAFKRNVDLIAATCGRLIDHLHYSYANLNNLEYLILDEADRMLDMGFLKDVKLILKKVPINRQTMLFSATMPYEIVELSKNILNNPAELNIARKREPAPGISHFVFPVSEEQKEHLLLKLLEDSLKKSILIFTRTKHRANKVYNFLIRNGISTEIIHGSRSQFQRTEALRRFKSGKYNVLVATDIASRGIDIFALNIVLNFDIPLCVDDYIHRTGRTARGELKGEAYTFVTFGEEHKVRVIEKSIGKKFIIRKVEGFNYNDRLKREEKFMMENNHRFFRRGKGFERNENLKKRNKSRLIGSHRPFDYKPFRKKEDKKIS